MRKVVEFIIFLNLVVGFLIAGLLFAGRKQRVASVTFFLAALSVITANGVKQLNYVVEQIVVNKFPCLYWTIALCVSLPIIFHVSRKLKSNGSTVLVRKSFHFLVVAMFGLFIVRGTRSEFLAVAGLSVIAVLVFVECFRITYIFPAISLRLTSLVRPLLDSKDSGAQVVTSHVELLIAALGPVIVAEVAELSLPREMLLSGILTVGIGDSFAAIVGTTARRPRKLPGSYKSVQGAVAFFLSVTCALAAVGLASIGTLAGTLAAAATEAWLPNYDNISLPIVFSLVFYLFQSV